MLTSFPVGKMEGLLAFPCQRVATPAYPSAAKIRKRTNIVPNGTLTIGANAYRPVIVREVSVEGVSAILLGEYSSNSFTAYKSPKFDQVLSVLMAVGGAYTITNISGRATTIFYYVI